MLADLVRANKIEFHSYGRKLDKYPSDFGKCNWDLVGYLVDYSGNCLAIRGKGLEDYLKDSKNLYELTEFLVDIWSSKKEKVSGIHVDADIGKIGRHYKRPKEEPMYNGLGRKICDAASWVPEISYFEKLWNFALCSSVGGFVGYPGYEHPLNDVSFRAEMRNHAASFMIGTKKQLKRYRAYIEEYLKNVFDIVETVKKNPNLAFFPSYDWPSMENSIHNARLIAEHLNAFENM